MNEETIFKGLTPEARTIVEKMLDRLKATPFDGRTKATILMLGDANLMAGHREEIESFFLRRFYWNH